MKALIDALKQNKTLDREGLRYILLNNSEADDLYLFKLAREVTHAIFSNHIYIRGLIEISNDCKNDCFYCGIRKSNYNVQRYHLSKEEIMSCCEEGYALGFRTFVLQGGENNFYDDDRMCDIIKSIRNKYKDCAITLSLGEKDKESYQRYFNAGANRYLLRHETCNLMHYRKLHPPQMHLENRVRCLYNLKEIGYQVGSGIMVGSPFQNIDDIIDDIYFMKELNPEMIGIGPFLPHLDTPFRSEEKGSLKTTLRLLAIFRLMNENALIPSTTALGTLDCGGREKGILAGANVVMPNLSPKALRKQYTLYDDKICTDEEASEGLEMLKKRIAKIGYQIVCDRGDSIQGKD